MLGVVLGLAMCQPQGSQVLSVSAPAVPVDVETVTEGELDDGWTLPGQVRAASYASVGVGATGEIRTVTGVEGAIVEQGAVLLTVDDALIKSQMDRAKLEYDGAVATGNPSAYLKAKVDELSILLVRHELRAPFRGLIANRYKDVGDWAYIGDIAFDLVSLGEVEVIVDGPPELLGDVQPGATASLIGRDTVLGEVLAVIPVIDPASGLVRMRLQPAEPREWLVHGATIGVQVPLARTTNGVVVPRDALVRSELGLEVIRVSGNRAIRVPVVQLATGEDDVLVRGKDLKVGDRVVTRGGDRLYTGQLLAISEPTP